MESVPQLLVDPMGQALGGIDREMDAIWADWLAGSDVLLTDAVWAEVAANVEHAHAGHACCRLADDRVDAIDALVKHSAIVVVVLVRADRVGHGCGEHHPT